MEARRMYVNVMKSAEIWLVLFLRIPALFDVIILVMLGNYIYSPRPMVITYVQIIMNYETPLYLKKYFYLILMSKDDDTL